MHDKQFFMCAVFNEPSFIQNEDSVTETGDAKPMRDDKGGTRRVFGEKFSDHFNFGNWVAMSRKTLLCSVKFPIESTIYERNSLFKLLHNHSSCSFRK